MKILFVAPAYPLRGGIAQFTALLFKKVKERGHSAKIFSFKRQYPKFLFPGKSQFDSEQETIPVESEHLIDSVNPITWIKTAFKVRNYNPDVVIFMYWMSFFAPCFATISFLVKFLSCTKTLYLCHNIIPHERRFGDQILTKIAFMFVDYFMVLSKSEEADLLSFKPDARYERVSFPMNTHFPKNWTVQKARSELGLSLSAKVILFFGLIRAYKGLTLLLEAIPFVQKQVDVLLIIAGEFYEDVTFYKNFVKEYGLENSVIFEDHYIPNNEVGKYFTVADVIVLPYVSATQSGILPIAYDFGKPVITTNVGGLPEYVKNEVTGLIVPPQNPKELAKAIVRFFKENLGAEYMKNIESEKTKYSWDGVVDGIEKLISK